MVVRSSSGDVAQPLLTQRRQDLLDTAHLQAPLRKIRVRVKQIGGKNGVAAAFGTLLFFAAITSFVPWIGTMARPERESAKYSDATLLLAKTTGLSNPDEAKVLLEALESGTLDFAALSSAMAEDVLRKAVKIKEAAEMEATRKIAEEQAALLRSAAERAAAEKAAADKAAANKAVAANAAAQKAAAEKAAAQKAAAEKAAAQKAAAEKAAAQKAAAEKAAAEKAAAASKSSQTRMRASQSDDVFNDEDEDDGFFDRVEDEHELLWDDFDDEFDDDEKEETEQLEDDDGFGDVERKRSRPFRSNRRPRSSHASAAAADRRRFLGERVGGRGGGGRKGGRGGRGDGRRRSSRGRF